MTPEQFALLQDKLALWSRFAHEGPVDLRDYNGRCAEALRAVLLAVSSPRPVDAREGDGDWPRDAIEAGPDGPHVELAGYAGGAAARALLHRLGYAWEDGEWQGLPRTVDRTSRPGEEERLRHGWFERLTQRADAWSLNKDDARVSIKLGDLRAVLAALRPTDGEVA